MTILQTPKETYICSSVAMTKIVTHIYDDDVQASHKNSSNERLQYIT
jgi:hypothetical protein